MAAFDPLAHYIIERVEEMKEEIHKDHGSYGFVYEVKVDGVLRIAKKPHPVFLTKVARDEKVRVLANFRKECNLLRGHVQTIFGKINVIVTLRVGPPPPPPPP